MFFSMHWINLKDTIESQEVFAHIQYWRTSAEEPVRLATTTWLFTVCATQLVTKRELYVQTITGQRVKIKLSA